MSEVVDTPPAATGPTGGRRFGTAEPVPDADAPFRSDLFQRLGIDGLQCGSGGTLRRGCINTDVMQFETDDGSVVPPDALVRLDDFYYLCHDATEPFPIADATFGWAYCEHFIEHLVPGDAIAWLREMRRILRPGGFLRISTPDLRQYARGYLEPENGFIERHRSMLRSNLSRFFDPESMPRWGVDFAKKFFAGDDEPPERPAFVLNQIFYFWGHRWIYDPDELRHIAGRAGFDASLAVECAFRQGRSSHVARLDLEHRKDGNLYMELERA